MLEIFTGKYPFNDISSDDGVVGKVYHGERLPRLLGISAKEDGLDDVMWETITRCWHQELSYRPQIDVLCLALSVGERGLEAGEQL